MFGPMFLVLDFSTGYMDVLDEDGFRDEFCLPARDEAETRRYRSEEQRLRRLVKSQRCAFAADRNEALRYVAKALDHMSSLKRVNPQKLLDLADILNDLADHPEWDEQLMGGRGRSRR